MHLVLLARAPAPPIRLFLLARQPRRRGREVQVQMQVKLHTFPHRVTPFFSFSFSCATVANIKSKPLVQIYNEIQRTLQPIMAAH